MLIAFEGIDCAGKTTLIRALSSRICCVICEEMTSPIGPSIRTLLSQRGSFFLKTFFFAADRAWLYENIALPALKNSKIVLWDRYVDSALAYRYAEIEQADIIDYDFVKTINQPFPTPDLTIYINIDVNESINRAKRAMRHEPYDERFLTYVKAFYDKKYENTEKCMILDGKKKTEELCEHIIKSIEALQVDGEHYRK